MIVFLLRVDISKQNKNEIRDKILKYVLGNVCKVNYDEVTIEKNQYGKPFIKEYPNIYFSISHCDKVIACSIDNKVNGIDVELIRNFDMYVANRVCSKKEIKIINNSKSPEKAFFSYWTIKESLGKALGVGLNYSLKDTNFIINKDKIKCNNKMFKYKLYQVFNDCILAISTEGNENNIILEEVVMVNGELN